MVARSLCPEPAVTHNLLCIELPESEHNGLALHFEVSPECQEMTLGPTATHEVGLAHRNMTPSNILLENGSQRVHNTDVGLTRAVDDVAIANPGVVTATPLDMPSDQAPGEAVDHHSDLYSLGHSLCTMYTTKLVFSEKKPKTHLKPTLFALLLLVSVIGTTEAAGITRITEYFGIILQLETQNGTLWVEIEDPNVTVSVDDGAVVVEGVGAKKLRLKPGKHKWMTTRNGEFASTHWVTIERGGKKILRAQQLPPAPKTASTTIPDEEEIPRGQLGTGNPETREYRARQSRPNWRAGNDHAWKTRRRADSTDFVRRRGLRTAPTSSPILQRSARRRTERRARLRRGPGAALGTALHQRIPRWRPDEILSALNSPQWPATAVAAGLRQRLGKRRPLRIARLIAG